MHVIATKTLREFWTRYPEGEIRVRDAHASFIGSDRVVFNIGGNKHRLIVAIRYCSGTIFVRFVGTHDEYNQVDPRTI